MYVNQRSYHSITNTFQVIKSSGVMTGKLSVISYRSFLNVVGIVKVVYRNRCLNVKTYNMSTKLNEILNELRLEIVSLEEPIYAINKRNNGFNECRIHVLEKIAELMTKYTETVPIYYKPRQRVKVIKNLHGHEFELSSIVTLIDRDIDNCKFWLCKDSMKICFLTEEEFEPIYNNLKDMKKKIVIKGMMEDGVKSCNCGAGKCHPETCNCRCHR